MSVIKQLLSEERALLIPGTALVLASLISILVMQGHPTGGEGHHGEIASESLSMHAQMLTLRALMVFGLFAYAAHRGIQRPLVLAGSVALIVSTICFVGATTIDGYVMPFLTNPDHQIPRYSQIAWAQLVTGFGFTGMFATATVYALLSLDMMTDMKTRPLAIGMSGLAIASFVIFLVVTNNGMNLPLAFKIISSIGIWGMILGLHMVFTRKA
ncbi:hypothetical protein V0U79_02495 [Hyphobacterium sp. HN65]|uniref:DUF998 domain-containing protein n=1 Tax=Hyphobacterium lacteum TaxID=3116575 RepID=A0ABU7LMR2_9PROT|nr:hypothetical protein [Hyphobacterium sp. HN65]MEE2525218.1 hypothetical protein [Hyphobacterium sp. HN65]